MIKANASIKDSLWTFLTTIRLVEDGRFSLTNIALIATTVLLAHPQWNSVAAFMISMAAYFGKKLIFSFLDQPKLNKPDELLLMKKEIETLRAAVALGTVRR